MIDFHQHLNPPVRSAEDILRHLDAHDCERGVLLPIDRDPEDPKDSFTNEDALAAARKYPDRLVAFCHVHPLHPDAERRLRGLADEGAVGFGEHKLHLPVDHPRALEVYALCGELGLPVLLHLEDADPGWNTGFVNFGRVVEQLPGTTFIGHAPSFWANIAADPPQGVTYPPGPVEKPGLTDAWLAALPNLYGDLSARSGNNALTRDPAFARSFVRRHRDKLLFATDCFCMDGRGTGVTYECFGTITLAALRDLCGRDKRLFRQLTDGNARQLLGL